MKSSAYKLFTNHVLAITCILACASSSLALGQDASGKSGGRLDTADGTPQVQPITPFTEKKPEQRLQPPPRLDPTRKGVERRAEHSPLPPNPDAKWVCKNTVAEVDPVWRDDKQLAFGFDIMNAGTSTLEIRAKGG